MIGIEMGLLFVKTRFLTGVDHRLPKPFGIPGLPVGASVFISKIGHQKTAQTNLNTKQVVSKSSILSDPSDLSDPPDSPSSHPCYRRIMGASMASAARATSSRQVNRRTCWRSPIVARRRKVRLRRWSS